MRAGEAWNTNDNRKATRRILHVLHEARRKSLKYSSSNGSKNKYGKELTNDQHWAHLKASSSSTVCVIMLLFLAEGR